MRLQPADAGAEVTVHELDDRRDSSERAIHVHVCHVVGVADVRLPRADRIERSGRPASPTRNRGRPPNTPPRFSTSPLSSRSATASSWPRACSPVITAFGSACTPPASPKPSFAIRMRISGAAAARRSPRAPRRRWSGRAGHLERLRGQFRENVLFGDPQHRPDRGVHFHEEGERRPLPADRLACAAQHGQLEAFHIDLDERGRQTVLLAEASIVVTAREPSAGRAAAAASRLSPMRPGDEQRRRRHFCARRLNRRHDVRETVERNVPLQPVEVRARVRTQRRARRADPLPEQQGVRADVGADVERSRSALRGGAEGFVLLGIPGEMTMAGSARTTSPCGSVEAARPPVCSISAA